MSSIIDYFKEIAAIPHCSAEADALMNYIADFARNKGYAVEIDSAKNILVSKGNPKLCLQAHYDMVCMGRAPDIEIYEEDGWLKARDSSLGADNGMAIAMMMKLMEEGEELEFLFTSDEEIGLVGASALSFKLKSKYMLNLDSEEEAEIFIGCAGGADIVASKPYALFKDDRPAYRVSVSGLPGGHSGVDIDKDIPNAIKLLAGYLNGMSFGVVSIEGGERRNSIPSEASAIIRTELSPQGNDTFSVEEVECDEPVLYAGEEIISLLHGFKNGVQAINERFLIPERSINLAKVSTREGVCIIETSARAMSAEGLELISAETVEFFKSYGYDTRIEDKYPSWKPETNSFTELVKSSLEEVYEDVRLTAIHAGLECGIIAQKYPGIKFASIGPTIKYPHSVREEVKIDSVENCFDVVKRIIAKVD